MSNAQNVELTSTGMKRWVADELNALRAGTISPQRANATAKLTMAIVSIVRVEMQAQQMALASGKDVATALPALQIG